MQVLVSVRGYQLPSFTQRCYVQLHGVLSVSTVKVTVYPTGAATKQLIRVVMSAPADRNTLC